MVDLSREGGDGMIEKAALLKEVFDIQNEIQLSLEYETDARDIWPKRWQTLFTRIRDWPEQDAAKGDH